MYIDGFIIDQEARAYELERQIKMEKKSDTPIKDFIHPDEWFAEIARKNVEGELTVKEAGFGHVRLLEGKHAGRVLILLSSCKVDGKRVAHFANGFTWISLDEVKDTRCERVAALGYSEARNEVDLSEVVKWYSDSGDGPYWKTW